ncbi:glycosyltransferase [Allorhizobium undicola]|uniref:glycosyltransferase n=1 Tax=Allorhizobium undicola TaxID=78527 RepID=UPI003D34BFAC
MTRVPTLSVCVPSRNRQIYFQQTIDGLLKRGRDGVQFIFADNSDDPSIMNDFMAERVADGRVIYLPSTGKTLSMMDNWERTIEAATGEWVSFIGDDDFIDPELAGLLERVGRVSPDIEAFSWSALTYSWPYQDEPPGTINLPYERGVIRLPRHEPFRRMFGWFEPAAVPTSGFSIYHAAIHRNLLQRIHDKYEKRYFTHAVVDYDMAMKVICEAQGFGFSMRPFSIFGACPESNSFSIGRLEDTKKKAQIFLDEFGKNFEADPELRDFPFSSFLGVTATIGVVQEVFRKKYNIKSPGWEKGYATACARNAEAYRQREAFDLINAGYEMAFKSWKGGRFLKDYAPVWKGDIPVEPVSGFTDSTVMVRSDIAGVKNPAELWDVVLGMIVPVEALQVDEDGLKGLERTELVSRDLRSKVANAQNGKPARMPGNGKLQHLKGRRR